MAADKISIKVEADTRDAQQNLRQFQGQANQTAQAGERIGQRFDGAGDKVKAFAASVVRVGTAVIGATAAFAAGAYKVAEFAARVEQQEAAINRLGPAYDAVRIATNGVVTAQDALKAQQTLVQAGIRVSAEQLGTITRAAREYARATGTEVTGALEQLTDALRTNSAEGLGRFGVSLQQGQTGVTAFSSALGQLEQQQANTQVSARTLREDLDKLPEGLMELGRVALSIASGPLDVLMRTITGLSGVTTGTRGVLRELGEAGDTIRQRERQQATDEAGMARLAARERLIERARIAGVGVSQRETRGFTPEQMERVQRVIDAQAGTAGLTGMNAVIAGALRSGPLGQLQRLERQSAVTREIETIRTEIEAQARAAERAARGPTQAQPAARRTGGGADPSVAAMRSLRQAMAAAMVRGAPRVEIGRPDPGETLAEYLGRLTSIQQSLTSQTLTPAQLAEGAAQVARQEEEELKAGTTRSEAIEAMRREEIDLQQRRFARDRETRRMARAESLGGRALSALGIETDEEGRVRAFDALQTGADMLGQSLGTLRSGFSELFNTLASGSMSAGEAFQQFAAKTLKSLGEMSINQGIALTFQGIAALFTNPVAAPLMLAGGAGLIALGTGLGAAGAAATPAPPSTGGAAPSAARSASGPSPRGDAGGGGNVTIVLSSLVPPGPRELQGLVHAQRQAGRYGLGDARMVPRQVRA